MLSMSYFTLPWFHNAIDVVAVYINEYNAQGVSFPVYIGIGAKFENTQKTGERRLHTAEYRTVLL